MIYLVFHLVVGVIAAVVATIFYRDTPFVRDGDNSSAMSPVNGSLASIWVLALICSWVALLIMAVVKLYELRKPQQPPAATSDC